MDFVGEKCCFFATCDAWSIPGELKWGLELQRENHPWRLGHHVRQTLELKKHNRDWLVSH